MLFAGTECTGIFATMDRYLARTELRYQHNSYNFILKMNELIRLRLLNQSVQAAE